MIRKILLGLFVMINLSAIVSADEIHRRVLESFGRKQQMELDEMREAQMRRNSEARMRALQNDYSNSDNSSTYNNQSSDEALQQYLQYQYSLRQNQIMQYRDMAIRQQQIKILRQQYFAHAIVLYNKVQDIALKSIKVYRDKCRAELKKKKRGRVSQSEINECLMATCRQFYVQENLDILFRETNANKGDENYLQFLLYNWSINPFSGPPKPTFEQVCQVIY